MPVEKYVNPRAAQWPRADFVVGNPPFIGNKRMRIALGDGYVEALRKSWPKVPETADLLMYWWEHAADLTRAGKLRRFGLITTNSLRQTFNRKVVERHLADKTPLSLVFAVPDHPWVDSADGAAVRIAMTVGAVTDDPATLLAVEREDCYVIDLFGLAAEEARAQHPALYQWLLDRVKPERDHNNRAGYRDRWWLLGEARGKLRGAWAVLPRDPYDGNLAASCVYTASAAFRA